MRSLPRRPGYASHILHRDGTSSGTAPSPEPPLHPVERGGVLLAGGRGRRGRARGRGGKDRGHRAAEHTRCPPSPPPPPPPPARRSPGLVPSRSPHSRRAILIRRANAKAEARAARQARRAAAARAAAAVARRRWGGHGSHRIGCSARPTPRRAPTTVGRPPPRRRMRRSRGGAGPRPVGAARWSVWRRGSPSAGSTAWWPATRTPRSRAPSRPSMPRSAVRPLATSL